MLTREHDLSRYNEPKPCLSRCKLRPRILVNRAKTGESPTVLSRLGKTAFDGLLNEANFKLLNLCLDASQGLIQVRSLLARRSWTEAEWKSLQSLGPTMKKPGTLHLLARCASV